MVTIIMPNTPRKGTVLTASLKMRIAWRNLTFSRAQNSHINRVDSHQRRNNPQVRMGSNNTNINAKYLSFVYVCLSYSLLVPRGQFFLTTRCNANTYTQRVSSASLASFLLHNIAQEEGASCYIPQGPRPRP